MSSFDQLYSKNKLAANEQTLRDFWLGKGKTVFSCYPEKPVYRQVPDYKAMVAIAVENIRTGANLPGFNIPHFIEDFGTVSTAAYWGGKRTTPEGGCVSIVPVIHSPADVEKAKPAEVEKGGDAIKAVQLYNDVSRALDTDSLYCSLIDIQGPLNTAALIWEQGDFMSSMYEEPNVVHKLLEKVTEQIIEIIKYLLRNINKVSGPLWPYIWLPKDIGIGITEDYMPLVSPKIYKEFGLPYIKRINDAFGGLFIHCCGKYEHQLENLIKSNINIIGMEFHYPYTKPETLFSAFGSSAVLVPYLGPQGLDEFGIKLNYIKYLEEKRLPETRLWYILHDTDSDFSEQVMLLKV